jgi:hypothetical protein
MSTVTCTPLEAIQPVVARTPDGCQECLRIGTPWVHLRLCLTCGHVGCVPADTGLGERLVVALLRFQLSPTPDAVTSGDASPLA